MPTRFSEFFELAPGADAFHERVFKAISDAENIVECYTKLYYYIANSIAWVSRQNRHDLMDNRVDVSKRNDDQVSDANKYFPEFLDLETAVLFEYFKVVPMPSATYGPNVFNLESANSSAAQKACRQVQLYLRVQIYNEEYDDENAYHQKEKTTTQPPNGKIIIDPAKTPVNPDDITQTSTLNNNVTALVSWIKANHPDFKATLNTKSLFDVFADDDISFEDTIEAVGTTLNRICIFTKRSENTRNAFGRWVIKQLKNEKAFWNNTAISNAYGSISNLERYFNQGPKKYSSKMFGHFKKLFANFLNGDEYDGESEEDGDKRRADALDYIEEIFQKFDPPYEDVYEDMLSRALVKIKKDDEDTYLSNLLRASKPIPADSEIKTSLPNSLAKALKDKADEIVQTLPLKQGDTDVRFFTIPNYEEMKAMSDTSVVIPWGNDLQSFVKVNSDPLENGRERYRPIYRGISYSAGDDEYIAFCNLENDDLGTFYYTALETPAVLAIQATNRPHVLTIDFQNYTIEHAGKPDKHKTDGGLFYRELGSTVNFFLDVRLSTKWTSISGVRRYDPYYTTDPLDADSPYVHLAGFVAAGRGVSRTWSLYDDSLCLWVWNASPTDRANFPKLGEILGLPVKQEIVPIGTGGFAGLDVVNKPCAVKIGDKQFTFNNYGLNQFQLDGFYYRIIGITEVGGKDELFYVQVNTPTAGVAATLTSHKGKSQRASRSMESDPGMILERFKFSYFRRITGATGFSVDSRVIQLFKPGAAQKPSGPGIETVPSPNPNFEAVGLNLPICFNITENIIQYYKDKKTRGKIINKGNVLFRAVGSRQDAGTAMKPLYGLIKGPLLNALSPSKIPATAFANGSMVQSTFLQKDWGQMKIASCNYLPIRQEWCHLRGHGDGGEEYPGNFVSGSLHCNTEQLAIESGQRLVTQQMEKNTFYLHTTAYLLRDAKNYQSADAEDRKSEILSGTISIINPRIAICLRCTRPTDPGN